MGILNLATRFSARSNNAAGRINEISDISTATVEGSSFLGIGRSERGN